ESGKDITLDADPDAAVTSVRRRRLGVEGPPPNVLDVSNLTPELPFLSRVNAPSRVGFDFLHEVDVCHIDGTVRRLGARKIRPNGLHILVENLLTACSYCRIRDWFWIGQIR